MNIITRRTLLHYINAYPIAGVMLQKWYKDLSKASFANFQELKSVYRNASLIDNHRVIFNIKGNDFRLVVSVNFHQQALYIIWFGTHAEYDKINVNTITYRKERP